MCLDGLIARPPGPGVARLFFLDFPGILYDCLFDHQMSERRRQLKWYVGIHNLSYCCDMICGSTSICQIIAKGIYIKGNIYIKGDRLAVVQIGN